MLLYLVAKYVMMAAHGKRSVQQLEVRLWGSVVTSAFKERERGLHGAVLERGCTSIGVHLGVPLIDRHISETLLRVRVLPALFDPAC